MTITENWYSYTERDALGILHALEKPHHYCFIHKVCMITHQKLLVTIINKDVMNLKWRLQLTLLYIQQFSIRML